MSRYLKICLLGMVVVALTGFSTAHSSGKKDSSKLSLVVTYIDTSEASLKLKWAKAKRLSPKPILYYQFGLNPDNILYNSFIGPGSYYLERLGGVTNKRSMTRLLPNQGRGSLAMTIDKPGIYFLGSYKLNRIVPKDFSFTRYELTRIKSPTEKEVLTSMLKYATRPVKNHKHRIDPIWKERLQKRIRYLK